MKRLLLYMLAIASIACPRARPDTGVTTAPDRGVSAVSGYRWEPRHDMQTARMMPARALLPGDRVLVIGGFSEPDFTSGNSAEIYDRATDSWSYTQPVPRAHAGAAGLAVSLPEGQVLYFGGFGRGKPDPAIDGENQLTFLFDSKTQTWKTLASKLPAGFYAEANSKCVLILDTVICAGGSSDDSVGPAGPPIKGSAFSIAFELKSQGWSRLPDLNEGRDGAALIPLDDGRVFISGGRSLIFTPDNHERYLASTEFYSPETHRWILGPAMPSVPEEDGQGCANGMKPCYTSAPGSRWGHIAHKLPDGKILIAGGNFNSDVAPARWGVRKSAFIFDPKQIAQPWRRIADLPEPRAMALAIDLADGSGRFDPLHTKNILIFGGQGAPLSTPVPDCGMQLELYTSLIFNRQSEQWLAADEATTSALPLLPMDEDVYTNCKLGGARDQYKQPASSTYNNQGGVVQLDDGAALYSGGINKEPEATDPFSARTILLVPRRK